MPRIEIIPSNHRDGDATPSVDVCQDCKKEFRKSNGTSYIPARAIHDVLEQLSGCSATSFAIGSTDVEHPDYDEDFKECVLCGEKLTQTLDG